MHRQSPNSQMVLISVCLAWWCVYGACTSDPRQEATREHAPDAAAKERAATPDAAVDIVVDSQREAGRERPGEPPDAATKTFQADPSLLVPWSAQAQGKEPYSPPYLVMFRAGKKQLLYLAAEHETGLQTETFRLVKQALDGFKPQLAVVEGYPTAEGLSPKDFLDYATSCWGPNGSKDCGGEPAYLAYLAHQASIPFVGGEPTDAEILRFMKAKGYTAQDLMGFYYVRDIPLWRQEGRLHSDQKKQFDDFILALKQSFGTPGVTFSFEEFKAWYKKLSQKAFDAMTVTEDDSAPVNSSAATALQKLAYDASLSRDTHLVQLFARLLNQYDKVYVVYGGGHLVTQRAVLRAMLGEPAWSAKTYQP